MITFQQFFKRVGVRKEEQLLAFQFPPLKALMLPNRPVYHYLPTNTRELGVDLNDYIVSTTPGNKYCIHQTVLQSFEGNPIRNSINDTTLIRDLEKKARQLRRVRQFETVDRDNRSMLIYNYSLLQALYKYRNTFLTSHQRWINIFNTCLLNVKDLLGKTDRHHYLTFQLPLQLPGIDLIRSCAKGLNKDKLENLRTPEAFFLLELWKWAGDQSSESAFSKLGEQGLERFNIVVIDGDHTAVLNFGQLNEWRKSYYRVNEEGEEKGDGATFQKRVLYFFVQMAKKRQAVEDAKQTTAVQAGAMVEISPTDHAANQALDEAEQNGDQDALQDELEDEALLPKKSKRLEDLEAELKEMEGEKAELALPDLDDESVFEVKEFTTAIPVGVSSKDFGKDIGGGVKDKAEKLLEAGVISVAEAKRFARLADKYKEIRSPWSKGETLEQFLVIPPEDLVIDPEKTKLPDIEGVLDKSMLNSSLLEMDSKYLEKVFHKDLVAVILSLQRAGVAITDIEVSNVTDAVNKYEVLTIKLVPVGGKPTTINIPLPKIQPDGTWIAHGVKYRLRKQRKDYPIHKTGPSKVAITSYKGKLFLQRSEKVVHNLDRWLQSQVISSSMDPNGVIKELKYQNIRPKVDGPKIPRLYSSLAKRFASFKVGEWSFYFDYENRDQVFGEAAMRLEQPNIVVFAQNGGEFLYIDDRDTVYNSDRGVLKTFGGLGEAIQIPFGKAPIEQTEVKICGKNLPLGVVLGFYLGLDELVARLGVEPRKVLRGNRLHLQEDEYVLRFMDVAWVFSKQDREAAMLLSGFIGFQKQTINYNIEEFFKPEVYLNLLESKGFGVRFLKELEHLKDFFIDPMTLELLEYFKEPTEFIPLLIRANELLVSDNVPLKLNRYVGYERIAGAVYRALADSVKVFSNKPINSKAGVDLKPNEIWNAIQSDPSISLVQDANPIHNLKEQESVTLSGTGGQNSRTVVKAARAYDPADKGVISEATVDSSDVAINTFTSSDPNFVTVRGVVRPIAPEDGMTKIMSTSANISPGATNDDRHRVRLASNCQLSAS